MDKEEVKEALTEGVENIVEEPEKIKWNNQVYIKCPGCGVVNLRKDPTKPDKVCEDCRKKPVISEGEKEWMRKLKEEINVHKRRYDERKKNAPADWEYWLDEDRLARADKIHELSEFGKRKSFWVYDGVDLY